MKRKMKRFLGILLSLALVLGLMPGMSLTALAWEGNPYESLKNTTTVIKFDNKDWYLIEDDSTAVNAGTVTLLAKECVGASNYNGRGSGANYTGSSVESFVNTWYAGNISEDVKTAVSGGKMFLLTIAQANAITNVDVRKCSQASGAVDNEWWLGSPGTNSDSAAEVYGNNGNVNSAGSGVHWTLGVRPALKLDLSEVTFNSTSKTFSLKSSHTHSFTYSASGATLTATCANTDGNCTLPEVESKHIATLTISAPLHTTYGDGKDATAVITDGNSIQGDAKVQYQKKTDGSYGTATETAPTDAGDYKASITVGGATAGVEYTIAQAATSITENPTAGEITYGQTLANSTLTGGTASKEGTFAWKDSTVAPAVADSQTTEYDVVFTPTDGNYGTAECKVKLTVNKADSAVTKAPTANTLTYNGSAQELVTAGTATGGTMQYALGKDDKTAPTEGWSEKIPTGTDAGTYYVWFKAVGDASHSDSEPEVVKVEIAKDDAAVDAVKQKINALPESDKVTVNDKKAIEDARAAFDKLTDEQKAQIPAETVKKLEDAEKAVAAAEKAAAEKAAKEKADAEAAAKVTKMINDLPAKPGVEDGNKVKEARKAYDALTGDQKKLVKPETVKKLEDAEKAVAKAIEEKKKADAEAAAKVTKKINALPKKLKLKDEKKVKAARKAYDALTDDQKKMVKPETLKKLKDAEKALKKVIQKAKKNKNVKFNKKTASKKQLHKRVVKIGASKKYIKTFTLGKKVKKIKPMAFKTYKKAKTLVIKTKKLTKKSVKAALKSSKIKKIKVKVGSKKMNKKFVKKYKKFFTKKNAGKKVKIV